MTITAGKIRVGLVTPTMVVGGATQSLNNLTIAMVGTEVEIVGLAVAQGLPQWVVDGPDFKDTTILELPIYVHYNGNSELPPNLLRFPNTHDAVKSLAQQCDLLLAWGPCHYARNFKDNQVPMIITCRGGIGCRYTRSWLTEAIPYAQHYVSVSQDGLSNYPGDLRDQVSVIPNTYDPDRLKASIGREEQRRQWGLTDNQKVAGYLGRCSPEKGITRMVDAVAMLPDDWVLVLATPTNDSLDDYCKLMQKRLEQRLPGRFIWHHPGVAVGDTLKAFDVYLSLSEQEGCGNSVIEAWHVGLPVVYRPLGIVNHYPEAGTNVGLDSSTTASLIAYYVIDTYYNLAPKLIEAGKAAAEDLSLTKHTERWLEFFKACVANNPLHPGPDNEPTVTETNST